MDLSLPKSVKVQLYILIKKWINSALNSEAYSSFQGVSSDLRIVAAKIRLSLRRNNMKKKNLQKHTLSLVHTFK